MKTATISLPRVRSSNITLQTQDKINIMPNYKIYRKNNYLFVQDTVTDEIISGLAKDVRVYRLEKTDGNAYRFVNTSNDTKLASVPYTSIKEEDGTDFADEKLAVPTFVTVTTAEPAPGTTVTNAFPFPATMFTVGNTSEVAVILLLVNVNEKAASAASETETVVMSVDSVLLSTVVVLDVNCVIAA